MTPLPDAEQLLLELAEANREVSFAQLELKQCTERTADAVSRINSAKAAVAALNRRIDYTASILAAMRDETVPSTDRAPAVREDDAP